MGHFRSDLRDVEFDLFEVFRVQHAPAGPDIDTDADTLGDLLRELERLATGPLAEGFAEADRHPPVFDAATHSVTLPEPVKCAYRLLWDGEWWRLGLPAELGGIGVPATVQWAAAELILGANPAVYMYLAGPRFASIVHRHGTPEQRRWAELMIERGWGATMVLTEPDAGSDVGAGRTRAVAQPDGTWHLEGVKRFITSAEHDLTENIMHLVLARPEAPGLTPAPGTKGLSLFLVPKYRFDPVTGEPGARNGAFVTNVEHKMGLKASATCELVFGRHGVPAVGHLLGDVHDGIAQMFEVIEHARMMVGAKAIGTLSTGYRTALEYAKERVQGPDLTHAADRAAPRVTIIHHADVRRMLLLQKAYAEGLRALYLYTATQQDAARAGGPDRVAARCRQRPAAAGRQGRRQRAGLGDARALPADPGRLGLPAGLPDRAVRPRRPDRRALRGHHRDTGDGPALPQDHPRPRAGARARRRGDHRVPRRASTARGQRPAQGGARAAGHGARRRPRHAQHAHRARRRRRARAGAGAPGRPARRPVPDGAGRPARRLAPAPPRAGGAGRAGRRCVLPGPRLLRGQGRRGAVLRRDPPAAAHRGARDRREHRRHADGARGGGF